MAHAATRSANGDRAFTKIPFLRSRRTAKPLAYPKGSYDQAMRALLVEDDASIADFVVCGLKAAGFAVDHADMGHRGPAFCLGHGADFPAGAQLLATRGNI